MGYWDDPDRPIDSYSDDYQMPNGRTPRQHARIQRAFKLLFKARLIRDAQVEDVDLFTWADRLDWTEGVWYLGVRCAACGVQFAFSREDKLTERFYFTKGGEIVLGCPECKMPFPYSGDRVIRVQAR